MLKNTFFLLSLTALGACAYAMDKGYQSLTIRTPGAQNATCDAWADNVRYRFFPPQTRDVKKSKTDLTIRCMAPGNREQTVVIRPAISDYFAGNVANGFLGGASWDYASGAMFEYPSVVDVDFTNMQPSQMALPVHNNSDNLQPEDHMLEEFSPSTPRMNADKYKKDPPIQRRIPPGQAGDAYSDGASLSSQQSTNANVSNQDGYSASDISGADSGDKGDLMSVLDNLGADMNPAAQSNAVLGDDDAGLPHADNSGTAPEQGAAEVSAPNQPIPLLPEE
ncbi:MAG: hypothetical protein CMH27_06295 [Micavibrio sp.]|nr:hypothetical protein [Micavibrio sp.]|tara:strand:- start:875 stop:1711 length:837 start_codon:yes stop_codon:yes gene_type:complete